MTNTIKECFDSILHGNKSDSRLAARRVRKLLYNSTGDREKYKEIEEMVETATENYSRISEDWRQENFVIAISVIYFLHGKEEQPDFLFPWLFELLQHPNGYIRHAAVKMISNELGPLTVHIRFPDRYKSIAEDKFNPEEANRILLSLSVYLHALLNHLWQPKYKKYKYINSLPPSPYKSVQMVLARLNECSKES